MKQMLSHFVVMAAVRASMIGAAIQDRYSVKNMVRRSQNEVGATAIEYLLIAAGISVAIIATVQGIGGKLAAVFGH